MTTSDETIARLGAQLARDPQDAAARAEMLRVLQRAQAGTEYGDWSRVAYTPDPPPDVDGLSICDLVEDVSATLGLSHDEGGCVVVDHGQGRGVIAWEAAGLAVEVTGGATRDDGGPALAVAVEVRRRDEDGSEQIWRRITRITREHITRAILRGARELGL